MTGPPTPGPVSAEDAETARARLYRAAVAAGEQPSRWPLIVLGVGVFALAVAVVIVALLMNGLRNTFASSSSERTKQINGLGVVLLKQEAELQAKDAEIDRLRNLLTAHGIPIGTPVPVPTFRGQSPPATPFGPTAPATIPTGLGPPPVPSSGPTASPGPPGPSQPPGPGPRPTPTPAPTGPGGIVVTLPPGVPLTVCVPGVVCVTPAAGHHAAAGAYPGPGQLGAMLALVVQLILGR